MTAAQLTLSFGFLGLDFLFVASAFFITLHVNEIVHGFHASEQLIKLFQNLKAKNKGFNGKDNSYFKIVSSVLQLLSLICAIIPWILVPAEIYANIDPYVYSIPKLIPQNLQNLRGSKLAILIIRIYLAAVCSFELSRFYALYFPICIQLFEYQLNCMSMTSVYTIPFEKDPLYGLTFFKCYNVLQVVDQISNKIWCNIMAILMGVGFFIFVTCNVATVNCFGIMALEVYWLMPTVAVSSGVLHYFLLPLVIQVRTKSEQMLSENKRLMFSYCYFPSSNKSANGYSLKGFWNRKFYWRKFRSLKPMGFTCGPFFKFTNIKSQYFHDIFSRSVDGIMMKI